MTWRARLRRKRPPPSVDVGDPIAEVLRAVVDLNTSTKVAVSETYQRRVHAMIDELFLTMDRRGRRHDRT